MAEWPKQHQQLKEQVALIEIQDVERQLFEELRRAEDERQAEAAAAAAPPKKARRASKKAAASNGEADEEAAVRARSYPAGGAPTT